MHKFKPPYYRLISPLVEIVAVHNDVVIEDATNPTQAVYFLIRAVTNNHETELESLMSGRRDRQIPTEVIFVTDGLEHWSPCAYHSPRVHESFKLRLHQPSEFGKSPYPEDIKAIIKKFCEKHSR